MNSSLDMVATYLHILMIFQIVPCVEFKTENVINLIPSPSSAVQGKKK